MFYVSSGDSAYDLLSLPSWTYGYLAVIMGGMATRKDWSRLAARVRERRDELGLTQEDVRAAGGPSTATMRLIEGALQESYQPAILTRLEKALEWERGSARRILDGGEPALLPSAGYEAPPAGSARDGAHPAYAENESIPPGALKPFVASVRNDLGKATVNYGPGHTGSQAFTADYEAAVWDMDAPASVREQVIAIYRYYAENGTQANGEESDTALCRIKFAPSSFVTIRPQ